MSEFITNYSTCHIELTQYSHEIKFFDRRTPVITEDLTDLPEEVSVFKGLPPFSVKFDILQRIYQQEGRLVYDYNPFHNLILQAPREPMSIDDKTYYFKQGDLYNFDVDASLIPFDLKHPIDLEIQPSYDGSVNVIAYDNLNQAILVNSRFSAEELDTYRIIDRRGFNDTNLYEEAYLKPQVQLYKTSNVISQIELVALKSGGQLPVGSYTFYFKYQDQDGNETDVMAESGIIHCYIGNIDDPRAVRGGMAKEISDKLIQIKINNLDKSYDYINLYYVNNTSDYSEINSQNQYKILDKYVLNGQSNEIVLTISGYEQVQQISLEEIIQEYNLVDRQKSMAQVQNRLFQANVSVDKQNYRDLEDLSLRFLTTIRSKYNIGNLNHLYEENTNNPGIEYYDPLNLYSKLGYWDKEIYRLGIVYIINNKLTPVFNIRGGQSLNEVVLENIKNISEYKNTIKKAGRSSGSSYTYYPLYKDNSTEREFIPVTETKQVLNNKDNEGDRANENSAGVISIEHTSGPITPDGIKPLGLQLSIDKETLIYLKNLGITGFFFVRQKRIPTILFQGITQGYSTNQEIPLLYTATTNTSLHRTEILAQDYKIRKNIKQAAVDYEQNEISEWTANTTLKVLSNDGGSFSSRFVAVQDKDVIPSGVIYSPDLTLNTETMGDLLVGNDLKLTLCKHQFVSNQLKQDNVFNRHFYNENFYTSNLNTSVIDTKVILVQDSHPIKYSGSRRFRGSQGIAEEAWRFESLVETVDELGPNIPDPEYAIRGLFGTYAGLEFTSNLSSGTYANIHIPGYSVENLPYYFKVRYDSFQTYHAITDKYNLSEILESLSETDSFWYTEQFRGDCYIGNYTQRVNRNFQDPELPLNDRIIGNTVGSDGLMSTIGVWFATSSAKGIPYLENNYPTINRSDVNAVQLGHWFTFKVCSNNNIAYRSLDKRHVDEFAITGSNRSFYPFSKMSVTAEQKISESSVVNKGYSVTITPKYYIINPETPYLQDKFTNRIMFSDLHVNDSFRNSYRVFRGLDYQDYNLGYGSITKILEWNNNIMCIFEHGIGLLPINENAMVSGENAGDIYIRGAGILPKTMKIITDTYGSQWKDSIVQTTRFIYGIDHIAKKIWRTNGEQIELISDFKIQSFLNENITLNARENTPNFGIRNIRTHYNAFKEDVMFTYYDVDSVFDEKKWNICFNEQLNKWITRYDWEPVTSVSINNIYFSYDREAVEKIVLLQSSYAGSASSKGIVVSNYEIISNEVIQLTLKSSVLEKFYPKFYLEWLGSDVEDYDNSLFTIRASVANGKKVYYLKPRNLLYLIEQNKFLYSLRIKAILYKDVNQTQEYDTIYDTVHLRVLRDYYSTDIASGETYSPRTQYDIFYTTRFWKHGRAGIFFSEEKVLPTTWYKKTRPFEFEFIMNDQPALHKVLENICIISNNAEPDSLTYTVENDVYLLQNKPTGDNTYKLNRRGVVLEDEIDYTLPDNTVVTTVGNETISLYQKVLNTQVIGRLLGNTQYKESYWYIDQPPITVLTTTTDKPKQQLLKDKQIRIRVKYTGSDLAVITSLTSMYIQSYA